MPSARWLVIAALLVPAVTLTPFEGAATRSSTPPDRRVATAIESSNRIIEKRVIGHSVDDRQIWAYRKGEAGAERVVVVLGQMHGDERAGVRTAAYIKNHVPVALDTDVWVVPTMNPDGFAANTRRNARDVDLNRNWPTNWRAGNGSGSRALSEPETRAMFRFLKRVQPTFIASLHQPFGVVGRSDKNRTYVRRLHRQLDLPIARVQVGDCRGADCPPSPTLTSWYNSTQSGSSVTIEFEPDPTRRYLTKKAGPGILRAQHAL